jgi:hypothetical protein
MRVAREGPRIVPFFCYIYRRTDGVPHFEVLPEDAPEQAARRAAKLLADRGDAERAEIWQGDTLVRVVLPEAA